MPETVEDQTIEVAVEETTELDVEIGETYRSFASIAAVLDEPTSDNRVLAADMELSFRECPLPLMWCKQHTDGHDMSYTVGVIEVASVHGDQVLLSGYMLNTPEADEAAEQVSHGVSCPSIDLAAAEWTYTDKNGNEIEGEELWEHAEDGDLLMRFTKGEIIGTTLVATPAFGTTSITLGERESREVAIVASAAAEFRPRVYDHRLFKNPQLTGPTLPTMGEDGRIYGHLAVFGQCHRSIQDACVMVPRSPTHYSHFHTSPSLRLDDGSRMPVGRLTVGTGHADPRFGPGPAMAHYDNTGSCFALVRVGEDVHGVWFSGVAAPGATADQIEAGITAPLSGDWRDFGQGLELIAALAVNTPGFAARGRDDDQGRPIALVASVGPSPKTRRGGIRHLSAADIANAVAEGVMEAGRRALAEEKGRTLAARRDEALARSEKMDNERVRERIAELLKGVPR